MLFQYINADLLTASETAICHQVNCQNAMGSGVAKAIYTKWPEVKTQYHKICATVKPDLLLGLVQPISINGQDIDHGGRFILNIFGQFDYGRDGRCYTSYDAIAKAFDRINFSFAGHSLAFPYKFGCGLAGGDWKIVFRLMELYLKDTSKVVIYVKDKRDCINDIISTR